jgi:indolepyruvate ferredoxin oxidoreductase
VRGYGHVKLANLAGVKRGERDLAARLQIDPATGEAVKKSLEEMKGAGQLRGIPVVVTK